MKKTVCLLLCMLLIPTLFFGCAKKEGISREGAEKIANDYIGDFTSANYKAMVEKYKVTSSVAAALNEEVLKSAWEDSIIAQCGAFSTFSQVGYDIKSNNSLVYFDIVCEKATAQIVVSIDGEGNISGLNIYGYKNNSSFKFDDDIEVEEVTFGEAEGSGYKLNGSIVSAKNSSGNAPGAIIVSGSGPNDRYGNVAANHPYADIAQALAKRGVTVLIYDKMTYTYGTDPSFASKFANLTIYDEVVTDAVSAYKFLSSREGIDKERVYIIGHSLGGYCLPLISEALDSNDACGYVFLSAPSSSLGELMLYQIEYLAGLDGEVTSEEKASIDESKAQYEIVKGLTENNASQYTSSQLLNTPAAYWLSLDGYDPVAKAAGIEKPCLFLNGDADYQVPVSQLDVYKKALDGKEGFSFQVIEGVNHLLIDSNGSMSPDEYYIASTVSEKVINPISEFIR